MKLYFEISIKIETLNSTLRIIEIVSMLTFVQNIQSSDVSRRHAGPLPHLMLQ